MAFFDAAFLNSELSKPTSIFGLRLWVVIGICVGAFIVLILFLLSLCVTSRRRKPSKLLASAAAEPTPVVSKEIQEVIHVAAPEQRPLPVALPDIQIDIGKAEHRIVFSDRPSSQASGESRSTTATDSASMAGGPPEVSHLGWGHWYTLRELEEATGGLVDENVIGEGGYGIVYHGVLPDNAQVAVKNLLNNRIWRIRTRRSSESKKLFDVFQGQAEREFRVEVEAIGRVRHKNLVRLLGYCVEGAYRMLVYEYVENGNLDQWLHGDVGQFSPLTWDIRMNIILGTAKGYEDSALSFLKILRVNAWLTFMKALNQRLSIETSKPATYYLIVNGIQKSLILGLRSFYVLKGAIYVAPEYASTGMLTERSDVYSFGVLLMEIITGRSPVDYARPSGEVNLVDWLKTMVGNRNSEQVLDPKIAEKPSAKALKRALLVALRCVDPDALKRPKMGHVIHMLEADDLLFRDDGRIGRESTRSRHELANENHIARLTADQPTETYDTSEGEGSSSRRDSSRRDHQFRWR
ncbi:hypothetical protein ACLOJK_032210 [Asimina triloba]